MNKTIIASILLAISGGGVYYYYDIQPVEKEFPVVIEMSITDMVALKDGMIAKGVASNRAENLVKYFDGKNKTITPNEMFEWIRVCNETRDSVKITNWGEITTKQFIKKCNYLITEVSKIEASKLNEK